jgi:hypothetical protein
MTTINTTCRKATYLFVEIPLMMAPLRVNELVVQVLGNPPLTVSVIV